MRPYYRAVLGLLLVLGSLAPAWATNPPDSLRQALDYVFAPLDLSQVPAPYLADYGYQFLRPLHYTVGVIKKA